MRLRTSPGEPRHRVLIGGGGRRACGDAAGPARRAHRPAAAVRYLVGWGNRLITVVRWAWSLLTRNRGERVIDTASSAAAPRRDGRDVVILGLRGTLVALRRFPRPQIG